MNEQQIEQALDDLYRRTYHRVHALQYKECRDEELRAIRDDLLDHLAARTVTDPQLEDASSRLVLRTVAECSLGLLAIGCFPNGDQEICFPLIDEVLTSEIEYFQAVVSRAPTARDWLDTFAHSVISGLVWDQERPIGLTLRENAAEIRQGVPYSKLEAVSDPAELTEMNILTSYLTKAQGHLPRDWPSVTMCKPDTDVRRDGIQRLDALDALTPDQQLLRVLLTDDQPAFEQALADRLAHHRDSTPPDAAPRSLFPHQTIALTALAAQVHGWTLHLHSAYLSHSSLRNEPAA
ncbi:immunity 49 family protein [Streptomyces sp. NPDC054863]